MTTAENLKKFRRALCLSQVELAKALCVTVSTISNYENGRRKPSYPTIRNILALAEKHNIKINLDDIRPI